MILLALFPGKTQRLNKGYEKIFSLKKESSAAGVRRIKAVLE